MRYILCRRTVFARDNDLPSHHSPWSVGDLGVFREQPDVLFKGMVLVIVTSANQNQVDDIRGCVVEQGLRIHDAAY